MLLVRGPDEGATMSRTPVAVSRFAVSRPDGPAVPGPPAGVSLTRLRHGDETPAGDVLADAVRAAVAVGSVPAALARYAVVAGPRTPRRALRPLPLPTGGRPVLPQGWQGATAR